MRTPLAADQYEKQRSVIFLYRVPSLIIQIKREKGYKNFNFSHPMNYAKIQPKHTLRGFFMEFQTLIENRRSVRKYSSHTNVTKEQIQQLVQVALEAPSWKNTETGRYYCVLSEDMSQKLRKECLCYANNDVKLSMQL